MNNSSDFAKDILSDKQLKTISIGDDFSSFLVQKYISNLSPQFCALVNSTTNGNIGQIANKQIIYDLLKILTPKKDVKFFPFFKKGKTEHQKLESVDFDKLSETLEMSKRELKDIFENFPDIREEFVEKRETILKTKK